MNSSGLTSGLGVSSIYCNWSCSLRFGFSPISARLKKRAARSRPEYLHEELLRQHLVDGGFAVGLGDDRSLQRLVAVFFDHDLIVARLKLQLQRSRLGNRRAVNCDVSAFGLTPDDEAAHAVAAAAKKLGGPAHDLDVVGASGDVEVRSKVGGLSAGELHVAGEIEITF